MNLLKPDSVRSAIDPTNVTAEDLHKKFGTLYSMLHRVEASAGNDYFAKKASYAAAMELGTEVEKMVLRLRQLAKR